MAPDTEAETQPLFQPRVIRFLKNRRKLVGGELREEILEQVEENVVERRRPDTVAEKMVQNAMQGIMERAAESTAPVARERMRKRFTRANETILENL